jgi:hypothetical protein
MTYSPTEPQDLPPPVEATTQIRTNFSQFQTIFSNNHTALNKSNQGKHETTILESQSVDPEVTGNFVAFYCKEVTNAIGMQPQGFIQIPQFLPNSIPNFPEQITYNTVNTSGPYHTFIPGGYIMYFGMISSVPDTITLNPVCSKILSVVVNAHFLRVNGTTTSLGVSNATINSANSFTINSGNFGGGPGTFSWVAICQQ